MTTAHRPTFDPARGKESTRGPAYHQRLLPAHTHLKVRRRGQGGVAGLDASSTADTTQPTTGRRALERDLLLAEASARTHHDDDDAGDTTTAAADADTSASANRKWPHPPNEDGDEDEEAKRRRDILEKARGEDADSSSDHSSSSSDSESEEEEEEEESEDEEAALLAELNRIKAERAAERAREDAEREAKEQEVREEEIAKGNPLLNAGGGKDFGVKRRWDEDVVFRNQARGSERGKEGKGGFVNDMLRSEFHKRFMGRYVR